MFLDRACTRKFPIDLPPPERMRIHYTVVAHNISPYCTAFFPGSSGTLMFDSAKTGARGRDGVEPFVIGWMAADRPFVHVLDDESLKVLLGHRDTITDFVEYLAWKEALLQSARERNINVIYSGEEELLANFLLNMTDGGHGFALPDEPLNAFVLDEGYWCDFLKSPQRAAQIEADKDSYFWDYIIENFCKNILAGTSYDHARTLISEREKAVRMLAREPRTRRRILARLLIGILCKYPPNFRAVRIALPNKKTDPHYCFLLFPRFPTMPLAEYRRMRGEHLEALIRVTKLVLS